MATLSAQSIQEFEAIIRFPFLKYLREFTQFMQNNRVNIINYYSGRTEIVDERSFNNMNSLLKRSGELNDLIDLHRERLNSGQFWEVAELVTDIQSSLVMVENSSKWLRSAISKNDFTPTVETTHTLKKMQTLERVSGDVLGSSNRDSDWVRIALRNDLIEEQYTPDGGVVLTISKQGRLTIRLLSVVDNIFGEKVYGKDLNRKLTFNVQEEDLDVLSYRDTLIQSVFILSQLKQGMTPEFPQNGIQASLVEGTNINSVAYPIIFRQLYDTFSQDDTLQSLTVTSIETKQDALSLTLFIETRLGDTEQFEMQL